MLPVEIVSMTSEHLNDVTRIEEASFTLPWSRDSFQNEIATNRQATYFVAVLPGTSRVLGYAGMWVVLSEAHITTLAVDPAFRRQQIGSILLSSLMHEAFFKGARRMFLEVRDSNACAKKMYEKFSFTIAGRRKQYYCDEDALVMSRRLSQGAC